MKRALFFTLFFCLSLISCLAQENTTCPKIKVFASKSMYDRGEQIPFSVLITEKPNNLTPEYEWAISQSTISSGQGTASITVESAGLENTDIIATVKIKGLPDNCANEFHTKITIAPGVVIGDPAEIESARADKDVNTRLKEVYAALLKEPAKIAVVINNGTDKQVAARTARILKAIRLFGYNRKRFKLVRGSHEPGVKTMVFIVTKADAEMLKF